jgi:hypothetical protein
MSFKSIVFIGLLVATNIACHKNGNSSPTKTSYAGYWEYQFKDYDGCQLSKGCTDAAKNGFGILEITDAGQLFVTSGRYEGLSKIERKMAGVVSEVGRVSVDTSQIPLGTPVPEYDFRFSLKDADTLEFQVSFDDKNSTSIYKRVSADVFKKAVDEYKASHKETDEKLQKLLNTEWELVERQDKENINGQENTRVKTAKEIEDYEDISVNGQPVKAPVVKGLKFTGDTTAIVNKKIAAKFSIYRGALQFREDKDNSDGSDSMYPFTDSFTIEGNNLKLINSYKSPSMEVTNTWVYKRLN